MRRRDGRCGRPRWCGKGCRKVPGQADPVLDEPIAATRAASKTQQQPPPPPRKPQQQSLPLQEVGWQFPSLDLLKEPPPRAGAGPSEEALQANARLLETVLSDYGVQGRDRRDPAGSGGHAV